jgi:hypothetical protein
MPCPVKAFGEVQKQIGEESMIDGSTATKRLLLPCPAALETVSETA